MNDDEIVSSEVLSAMGISEAVLDEVVCIVGRQPKVGELSTLLAMWDANGRQQPLLAWLRGQHHVMERHDYIYSGSDHFHSDFREPRVRECVDIAHNLCYHASTHTSPSVCRGNLLYMVGNVSDAFLGSDYARTCLHIADVPVMFDSDEEQLQYHTLILSSLVSRGLISTWIPVASGGLFGSLVLLCSPSCGFDILSCREVRLDAFLFGEEPGRCIVALSESQDDLFVQKINEAGLNGCFLGRATKGRILVDGTDFGPISDFCPSVAQPPSLH